MLSPVLLFLIDKCGPLCFGMSDTTVYIYSVYYQLVYFCIQKTIFFCIFIYLHTFMELHK